MFPTAEIRWFFKGQVPDVVWDCFHGFGNGPQHFDPRTDHYLRMPDNDSLGIKLREGRLEIKQREGTSEVFGLAGNEGRIELWKKWDFGTINAESMTGYLESYPGDWIPVTKQRSSHLFGTIESGCGWELTKVLLSGLDAQWWSMGFEAFGNSRKEMLTKALDQVMLALPGFKFHYRDSYGYPYWLLSNV